MKRRPLHVRRKCNQNIMGKDVGFLHGFQKASGNLRMRKTDLYLLIYIQTEMSQSQIMPQMIQYTVFYGALGRKAAHRAASVCGAVHPCCKVRVCRSGVSLQTCREEHAVTTSLGTCQYPFP